jgi:hypothetical protein
MCHLSVEFFQNFPSLFHFSPSISNPDFPSSIETSKKRFGCELTGVGDDVIVLDRLYHHQSVFITLSETRQGNAEQFSLSYEHRNRQVQDTYHCAGRRSSLKLLSVVVVGGCWSSLQRLPFNIRVELFSVWATQCANRAQPPTHNSAYGPLSLSEALRTLTPMRNRKRPDAHSTSNDRLLFYRGRILL